MGGCLWGDLRVDALLGGAKIVELNTDRDIFGTDTLTIRWCVCVITTSRVCRRQVRLWYKRSAVEGVDHTSRNNLIYYLLKGRKALAKR